MNLERTSGLTSLALFCKVVDNFGDIGICWRLARQLTQEHQIQVQLWVDDLVSFQRICPEVNLTLEQQTLQGITLLHWRHQDDLYSSEAIADIVIEFFACDIPPDYIRAMVHKPGQAIWFNLEGLSAETWVEGCHRLPSSHPNYPITKHFFFPGFTGKTGGLLVEQNLEQTRDNFLSNTDQVAAFWRQIKLAPQEQTAFKISLFCYPHAPVQDLFEVWENSAMPILCLIPEGVAKDSVERYVGRPLATGEQFNRGALTLQIIPFLPQTQYDQLLWLCDFNFVRGEDSFVRAQWAGNAFVWHIYPQDEQLHHKKLRAFLQRYSPHFPALTELALAWNQVVAPTPDDWTRIWKQVLAEHQGLAQHSHLWTQEMRKNGDLARNLLSFAKELCQKRSNHADLG